MRAQRLTAIITLIVLSTLTRIPRAETKECTAVEKSAKTTANGAISVAGDKQAKTCSFSVGGATSSSADPGAAAVLREYRSLDPKSQLEMFRARDLAFRYSMALLGAASPTAILPESARVSLNNDNQIKSAFNKCLDATNERTLLSQLSVPLASPSGTFVCSVSVRTSPDEWPRRLNVNLELGSQFWGTSIPLPM
jgi:hypothetical protein